MTTTIDRRRHPAGGFVLISVPDLCFLWTAFRLGRIGFRDLRVWLACREISARREVASRMQIQRTARFAVAEIQKLVGGVGGKHLEASLRRLAKSQLLSWTKTRIAFPMKLTALDVEFQNAVQEMLESITNRRRRIPVPRRMLRFLAQGAGRTMTATVLGHLIRCLYADADGCRPTGTCKASWIASTFGVNERAVKRSRASLMKCGWLRSEVCPQWHRNRYGLRVEINLAWQIGEGRLSPPRPQIVTEKSLPVTDKKLLTEFKNQKPAERGPDGPCGEQFKKRPVLRNITTADLHEPIRLRELFRQAVAANLVSDSESERLGFFAAAEHARAIGARNAPGLFSYLVRGRRWHFCTQADEDRARRVLQTLDSERPPSRKLADDSPAASGEIVQSILKAWANRAATPQLVA